MPGGSGRGDARAVNDQPGRKPYAGVSGDVQPALLRTHAIVVGVPLLSFVGLLSLHPPGSGGGVDFGAVFAAMPLDVVLHALAYRWYRRRQGRPAPL